MKQTSTTSRTRVAVARGEDRARRGARIATRDVLKQVITGIFGMAKRK